MARKGLRNARKLTADISKFLDACPEEITDPRFVDKLIDLFEVLAVSTNGTRNDIALLHHENRHITQLR
ncbi:MAG: hypothetical protein OXI43_13885 [Candidatus Poribacteria bacterium]|nr:hypothetical protein [Candidatus Poribacteria bacterium]